MITILGLSRFCLRMDADKLVEVAVEKVVEKVVECLVDKVVTAIEAVHTSVLESFEARGLQATQNKDAMKLLVTTVGDLKGECECEGARGSLNPEVQKVLKTLDTVLNAVQSFAKERSSLLGAVRNVVGFDGPRKEAAVIENFLERIKEESACLHAAIAANSEFEV